MFVVDDMIDEVDVNGDGRIDFEGEKDIQIIV